MYGLAGYRHTPGMPYLDALDATPPRKSKGVAGQRPLRNKVSSERRKDNRNKDRRQKGRHNGQEE